MPLPCRIITLLESERDKIATDFQLVVNVFIDLFVSEELQHILLVPLHLIDHRDQEDQRDQKRARGCYQEIEEY
jgi:hypothetical protein